MKVSKLFFLVLGCVSLALGCVGIVLPVLPTVPFFLLTAFCFAKSSRRLHDWFLGTKLYRKHLESYVQKRGMTPGTKAGILGSATAIMALGAFFMVRRGILWPCGILAVVWVCHVVYFLLGVKTLKREEAGQEADEAISA